MVKSLLIFFVGMITMRGQTNDTIPRQESIDSLLQIANNSSIRQSKTYENIDENYKYQYTKPKFWQIINYVPQDIYQFGRFVTREENLKWDALTLGSTAILLPLDQDLLEGADRIGKKLGGWDQDSHYKKVAGIFNIIPENISSAVYYVGNGGTTILLSGIFYGIGKINHNDYRALHTSSELIECLLSVGVATQTIKRITGRQSPSKAIPDQNPGGEWVPFPSISAFQNNTPNYDAMPSGHLATYVATVTIIAINYPELKWVRPVGYALGGILAFNMVSTKVHWASDYPIAVLIGYVMGKTIAERRITKVAKNPQSGFREKKHFRMNYTLRIINNTTVIGTRINF